MSCVYVIHSDFCSLPTDSYLSFTLINDPFILPLLHVSGLFSYFGGNPIISGAFCCTSEVITQLAMAVLVS